MVSPPSAAIKIGELSARSQVSVQTIRYYEDIGLLPAAARTEGHFRLFAPETVSRLLFIKQLQLLGLSLQDIKECLMVFDRGDLPCADLRAKLEQHVETINQQIQDLTALHHKLQLTLQNWNENPVAQENVICPNLQAQGLDSVVR